MDRLTAFGQAENPDAPETLQQFQHLATSASQGAKSTPTRHDALGVARCSREVREVLRPNRIGSQLQGTRIGNPERIKVRQDKKAEGLATAKPINRRTVGSSEDSSAVEGLRPTKFTTA